MRYATHKKVPSDHQSASVSRRQNIFHLRSTFSAQTESGKWLKADILVQGCFPARSLLGKLTVRIYDQRMASVAYLRCGKGRPGIKNPLPASEPTRACNG